jgi:hypothetical protein
MYTKARVIGCKKYHVRYGEVIQTSTTFSIMFFHDYFGKELKTKENLEFHIF